MKMTGIYRFALLSDADEQLFVGHITKNVFPILQLTRITSGFTHTLLAMKSDLRQYAWIVTVTLVTDDGAYDLSSEFRRASRRLVCWLARRPTRTLLKRESSLTRADRSEND
ncbi:MAG TPA: hypothetical protein VIZ87_00355 [Terrimicrobium sp.]